MKTGQTIRDKMKMKIVKYHFVRYQIDRIDFRLGKFD